MTKRGCLDIEKTHEHQTVVFKSRPRVVGSYSVAGKREAKGPIGEYFSETFVDCLWGEKTHEQCEQKMFETAIKGAVAEAGVKPELILGGDLLNQITSTSFAARGFDSMFVGLYGACSTMALGIAVASVFVDGGFVKNAVAVAGSHFATAERQYRTPLELGNQRSPLSQWTVTGAGATVIAANPLGGLSPKTSSPQGSADCFLAKDAPAGCAITVSSATFGKVVDYGIVDVNNMGGAMSPAAMTTLCAHFRDTGRVPSDYDAIFTGDLGKLGEEVLRNLMRDEGFELDARYSDCGRLIYDAKQNLYQGGSGCGCSAVTLNGFIMDKLRKGEWKRVLFCATGALMSPVTAFQGNSIPGIAHAVVFETVDK